MGSLREGLDTSLFVDRIIREVGYSLMSRLFFMMDNGSFCRFLDFYANTIFVSVLKDRVLVDSHILICIAHKFRWFCEFLCRLLRNPQ